jgi:acetyl esterase/lipase
MTTTLPMAPGTVLPLWPGMAPEESPNLTVFLAPPLLATGAAVVICPGGGYGGLATDHEGVQIAQWLNARGVAGLMLRYRHAPHRHPVPLGDARRAVRLARAQAAAWSLDPARLGVWGFSAGGHLTASLGTHWDTGDQTSTDPVEWESCRPDFLILGYPVITMTLPHTHRGSRNNLLGEDPHPALVEEMSCEQRVTAETPPTFLFHTDNDGAVPVENSILFYSALRAAGVPAELHVYADGPHGVGLCLHHPILGTWPDRLEAWLRWRGVL